MFMLGYAVGAASALDRGDDRLELWPRRHVGEERIMKSAQEVGTLQSMYWIEIRTVPPVKLPLVAVMTIDVAE